MVSNQNFLYSFVFKNRFSFILDWREWKQFTQTGNITIFQHSQNKFLVFEKLLDDEGNQNSIIGWLWSYSNFSSWLILTLYLCNEKSSSCVLYFNYFRRMEILHLRVDLKYGSETDEVNIQQHLYRVFGNLKYLNSVFSLPLQVNTMPRNLVQVSRGQSYLLHITIYVINWAAESVKKNSNFSGDSNRASTKTFEQRISRYFIFTYFEVELNSQEKCIDT